MGCPDSLVSTDQSFPSWLYLAGISTSSRHSFAKHLLVVCGKRALRGRILAVHRGRISREGVVELWAETGVCGRRSHRLLFAAPTLFSDLSQRCSRHIESAGWRHTGESSDGSPGVGTHGSPSLTEWIRRLTRERVSTRGGGARRSDCAWAD